MEIINDKYIQFGESLRFEWNTRSDTITLLRSTEELHRFDLDELNQLFVAVKKVIDDVDLQDEV
jgi:tellurite resistance protein